MVKKYIKNIFSKLIDPNSSASLLAYSFCWGIFIGCSPLLGIQSYVLIGLSWFFKYNPTVSVAAAWIVDNPLTMIPIYTANYLFGSYLFEKILHINLIAYNPSFIDRFNNFLAKYIDLSRYTGEQGLCFWCFILGSFILPLIVSILAYLPLKYVFSKVLAKISKNSKST